MRLDKIGLENKAQWEAAGYRLPRFNRQEAADETRRNPFWIHFGAGNIFRAFQANVMQNLLNAGIMDLGLIVAEGFDYEIIEKMNRPHDDYSILVTLKAVSLFRNRKGDHLKGFFLENLFQTSKFHIIFGI